MVRFEQKQAADEGLAMTAPATIRSGTRETADDYRNVVVTTGTRRVIVCNGNIQWTLQHRRDGNQHATARWRNVGYCSTRKALLRLLHAHGDAPVPELAGLPERVRRRDGQ